MFLTSFVSSSYVRVKRYLGPIQLHFIKDAWTVRSEGMLGSFFYLLLSEVNAVARSQVAALGGNALLCHRLVPQEAGGRSSRNQGFTMFSVTGDAVLLEFGVDFVTPSPTDTFSYDVSTSPSANNFVVNLPSSATSTNEGSTSAVKLSQSY